MSFSCFTGVEMCIQKVFWEANNWAFNAMTIADFRSEQRQHWQKCSDSKIEHNGTNSVGRNFNGEASIAFTTENRSFESV